MKILDSILLLSGAMLISNLASTQTLDARYRIQKEIEINLEGQTRSITTLNYEGFLFKKQERYMSYKKPLYLQQYPEGQIKFSSGPSTFTSVGLFMDTIQGVFCKDYDSSLYRYRNDMTGRGMVENNYVRSFTPGTKNWELLNEVKDISGLSCQRAQLRSGNQLLWDVWFTASVPMLAGPSTIADLPGLVVEAYSTALKEHYVLQSYKQGIEIPDDVFWPAVFNQPFQRLAPVMIENRNNDKQKKLRELTQD